ncbi:TetR family transcriptional regulator [Anopheles sinensis]|uniref:TetR family transcriptional regulator n=1 Tax=Anopheles sinensis TaxID=74873 RepID=A0A084VI28_ANOSI|nr:TetR family transcriptional regulator [Anopheles sinensis]
MAASTATQTVSLRHCAIEEGVTQGARRDWPEAFSLLPAVPGSGAKLETQLYDALYSQIRTVSFSGFSTSLPVPRFGPSPSERAVAFAEMHRLFGCEERRQSDDSVRTVFMSVETRRLWLSVRKKEFAPGEGKNKPNLKGNGGEGQQGGRTAFNTQVADCARESRLPPPNHGNTGFAVFHAFSTRSVWRPLELTSNHGHAD